MRSITDEELNALIFWLDKKQGKVETCDGTLRYTRRWLRKNGLNVREVLYEIEEAGQACDCEVILNLWVEHL